MSLYKNLGYDPEKDFEPICLIGIQTNLLYTHPGSVPAKTLKEFVDYVKANPGKLTFGSGGIGVSGAPGGKEDDACAAAGIEAIREDIEL